MFTHIFFVEKWHDVHTHLTSGAYLLLVAEKTHFQLHDLPKHVRICGAIFPRIIFGTQSFDEGILVVKLHDETTFLIAPLMHKLDSITIDHNAHSIIAIVDGLSSHIELFLEAIFSLIPAKSKIIGAGAGKLTLKQEPVIFDNETLFENAALILQGPNTMSLGVKHGWEAIVSPLIATQCHSHELQKINFQDAYTVYKDAVEADTPMRFSENNFFDIAKGYPIGIMRYNKDFIVRDPIYSNGQNLTLVGSIDTNSVIAILKGDAKKLIEAAKEAAYIASSHAHPRASSVFIIDCISRYLYLEDSFNEELEAIGSQMDETARPWGVLSLGEIANANEENIEFYNKTCVVSTL
jgi:hypothetical protein